MTSERGFPPGRTPTGSGRKLATAAVLALASVTAARAATLGYHDLSDPVKTLGWVCLSDSAAPVRVHLFADTPGGRKLLDIQLADKRRDDLASICAGGSAHAFRFADYAASADGIALYQSTTPVSIRLMAETPQGLVDIAGTPRPVSFVPVGIWDAGLVNGRWRTDHDDPGEGTASAPLLLGDCVFTTPLSDGYPAFSGGGTDPITGCRYGRIITSASNAATSGSTWPLHAYWAVVANVEEAFDNPRCADGPPGQSRAIRTPGSGGLFGVLPLPDAEGNSLARRRMHLVLNSLNETDCRANSYAIPYLSFGAQADRGNDGVLTYLNQAGSPSTLRFGITLMDLADKRADAFAQPLPGDTRYSQAHVLIEAMWGGKKRWLFVELLPDPRKGADGGAATVDAHLRFNWHLVNSFLFPGADYVFKSAAVLTTQCAEENVAIPALDRSATYVDPATRSRARTNYAIDLQKVFACLDRLGAWGAEPMPSHAIPVTGIHFGIEQDDAFYRNGEATGERAPNAVWIAVDNVSLD